MISNKPLTLANPASYRPRRKPVTIAIGFACDEGLLFCSDTKITTNIKTNENKIEHWVSDDDNCSIVFAISSTDINFPKTATKQCWEYVSRMDFSTVSMEAVHHGVQFSLAEFYREHIYPHPDRTTGAVFLELLVGIWLRGETRLYVSHETVLNEVDHYECIGSGAYLAKYLIRQYQQATDGHSLQDASLIADFAVQGAIDYDESCGGEPEMFIIKNNGHLDSICPAVIYPGTLYTKIMQTKTWKLLHDLAQVKDNYETETAEIIENYCAGVRMLNRSCQTSFDNFRTIQRTNPTRWD